MRKRLAIGPAIMAAAVCVSAISIEHVIEKGPLLTGQEVFYILLGVAAFVMGAGALYGLAQMGDNE